LATKSTTSAEQIVRFARPFGQILSPPQRLPTDIPLSVSFCVCQKRTMIIHVMINEHLSHRRRWGADRICPNGLANLTICSAEVVDFVANPLPIKGRARQRSWIARVRISKSDYLARRADSSEGRRPEAESKPKVCECADSRFVLSHVSTPDLTLPELDSRRFKRAKRSGEQTESLRTRFVLSHVSTLSRTRPESHSQPTNPSAPVLLFVILVGGSET